MCICYLIANTFRTKIIEFVYFSKIYLNQISKICQLGNIANTFRLKLVELVNLAALQTKFEPN